jgi:hypothetical protein
MTPKQQFKVFDQEIQRLYKKVPLPGWRLEVYAQHYGAWEGACSAVCQVNLCQRSIAFGFNLDKAKEGKEYWTMIARHEYIHAILAPLAKVSQERYITAQQQDSAEHEVLEIVSGLLEKALTVK